MIRRLFNVYYAADAGGNGGAAGGVAATEGTKATTGDAATDSQAKGAKTAEENPEDKTGKKDKTYTNEELNNIVAAKQAAAAKKATAELLKELGINDPDAYKKDLEKKHAEEEAKKSDMQKLMERLDAQQKQIEKLVSKNDLSEIEKMAIAANIPEDKAPKIKALIAAYEGTERERFDAMLKDFPGLVVKKEKTDATVKPAAFGGQTVHSEPEEVKTVVDGYAQRHGLQKYAKTKA
jgi:hypothetical protein